MTCYMHHMVWLFTELGLEYSAENRDRVDAALRKILRVAPSAKCPEIWRLVKDAGPGERAQLVESVRDELGS